jgi:hypothetical protein
MQFGFGVQTGTLSVEHPDTRAVVVIGDYRREFASGDTLVLPEGDLQLRFGFPSYRDVLVTVTIRSDQPSHLRLDPKPLKNERERALHSVFPAVAWQANLIIETDDRSRLSLNGEPLDSTVVALQLEPGRYKLEAVDAYGRRRTKNMNISATRLTYVDMTNPQPKDRLSRAAFVPGLAQYHRNEVVKSVLFAGGLGALAYFSYSESYQYNQASNRYDQTRKAYTNVISPEDLIILADRGIRQADVANTALRHRNIVWGAFLAAYVLNVMDGRRPGPAGYRTSAPKVSPFVHPDEAGLRISW